MRNAKNSKNNIENLGMVGGNDMKAETEALICATQEQA